MHAGFDGDGVVEGAVDDDAAADVRLWLGRVDAAVAALRRRHRSACRECFGRSVRGGGRQVVDVIGSSGSAAGSTIGGGDA